MSKVSLKKYQVLVFAYYPLFIDFSAQMKFRKVHQKFKHFLQ